MMTLRAKDCKSLLLLVEFLKCAVLIDQSVIMDVLSLLICFYFIFHRMIKGQDGHFYYQDLKKQ